jgi:ribosomal protein S27E
MEAIQRTQEPGVLMSDQAFIKQEIVDENILNIQDIRCPNCKNNTLVLSGYEKIPQKEIMEAGIITSQLPGSYEDGAFDLEKIDCLSCNTEFIIKDHTMYQLEKENLELKKLLSVKDNKPGKIWIN